MAQQHFHSYSKSVKLISAAVLAGIISCLFIFAISADSTFQDLEDYIDFRAKHDRYSGITAIYKEDQLVFESIKGLASRSWEIPNTAETRFNLASVTKMFTATAIGILLDRGKIELEAPIIRYFPDFPNKEIAESTTVKQLLSHTSGISDLFFQKDYLHSDRYRLRELKDYDRFLAGLTRGSVPENQILYSNSNYIILGRIIEKLSDQSYYEFVKNNIFIPAGMLSTGFFEADLVVPHLATGYSTDPQASAEFGAPNDGRLRKNSYMKAVRGMPAGGAYSTAADLHRFFSALHKGKLVRPGAFQRMIAPLRGGYGLGFQNYTQNDIQVYGHSGGFYGVSTMVFHLPDEGYTFISLTNCDFGAQPVFDRFLGHLSGRPAYRPIHLPAEQISIFEGHFEVVEGEGKGSQLFIEAKEKKLLFDNALDFFPMGKNQFFDIDNDQFTLAFEFDDQGRITGFTRTDGRRYFQKAKKIKAAAVRKLQALDLSDEILQQYLGNYQFGEEGMMPGHRPSLQVSEGGLLIDNMMQFTPFEKDKFFLKDDPGMQLHFRRNKKGEISGIKVMRGETVVGRVKKIK